MSKILRILTQDGNKNQAPSSKAGAALANDDGNPMTEPTGTITDQMRNSDQRVRLSGDGETHGDYRTADAAIAAMERLKDQPFFITCGFTKPHAAPAAPSKFYDLYPAVKQTLLTLQPIQRPPKAFRWQHSRNRILTCFGIEKQKQPTLASLCGLTPPADLQGHDLKALLEDPSTKWTHPAFSVAGSATNLHRSVRIDQWRYIEWSGKDGGAALIDEANDPREQVNLINSLHYKIGI